LKRTMTVAFATLCIVAGVTSVSNVQAQTNGGETYTRPYTLKLGVYTPSGTDARAQAGQVILGFEGTYNLQRDDLENQNTILGVGYYERNGLRIMPLTLTQLQQKGNQYTGYGIGAYNARPNIDQGDNRNKSLFGVHYLIGKNLDENRFVEAKFNYANQYNTNFSVNGFQLSYGVRF
jgi:hypothetical protein